MYFFLKYIQTLIPVSDENRYTFLFYLDSRTLQVLLVKLEITSCRISFRYLSTYNDKYSQVICTDNTFAYLLNYMR